MTYLLIGAAVLLVLFVLPKLLLRLAARGKFENIDTDRFRELTQSPDTVVLDVRQPGEVAQGKIKGAKVINVMSPDFAEKAAQLPRDKTYLVYCRSGNRSALACGKMAGLGFEKLYNLEGGYMAWRRREA